jgi:DNA-binding SARP family transcriptional activator
LSSLDPERVAPLRLALLGGFELYTGQTAVPLPLGARRVLAFLALQEAPLLRTYVAEALWPNSSRRQASANLRSAVWRSRQASIRLLDGSLGRLTLGTGVLVDIHKRASLARRLLDRSAALDPQELRASIAPMLSGELLPDWFDEWLLLERDRWNQLRLRALEALAERLLGAGEYSQAVEAGLAAVWAEPLRESAHRVLIRVYAAEGNWSQALAQYRHYRQLLDRELSVLPTIQMEQLMRELTPS